MSSTALKRPKASHSPIIAVELDDLGVGELRLHTGEERVVEGPVVERELLRVLDGESLLHGVVTRGGVVDVGVELLGDAPIGHLREPPGKAHVAAVDLRDPHAGDLADPRAHEPIAVHRGAQAADCHTQFGERLHTWMSSPPSPSGTVILAIAVSSWSDPRAYDVSRSSRSSRLTPGLRAPRNESLTESARIHRICDRFGPTGIGLPLMGVVPIRENGRMTALRLPLPLLPAGPAVHPALAGFHPAVAEWFRRRFPDGPTAPQAEGWPHIAAGHDTLIAAPTGSGKTLAGVPRVHRPALPRPRARRARSTASPASSTCRR